MTYFNYGTSKSTLGTTIRSARVSRIRAHWLEDWGKKVMALEDELETTRTRLREAERLLASAGRIDGWGEEVERFLVPSSVEPE